MTNGENFIYSDTGTSTFLLDFGGVTDGLSNTIFIAEAATKVPGNDRDIKRTILEGLTNYNHTPQNCWDLVSGKVYAGTTNAYSKGQAWGYSLGPRTQFITAIPPNGPSCTNHGEFRGFVTASSNHPGGANVGLCDGTVRFVPETIDSGSRTLYHGQGVAGANTNQPVMNGGSSTYGVWGAMGTISGGEAAAL